MAKISKVLHASAGAVMLLMASTAQAAVVAIVQGSFYTPDLKNQLIAQGNTVVEIPTYTAASLTGYDAVVMYGNTYTDQAALQTYVNAGGTLILTPWSGLNFTVNPGLAVFQNGGSPVYSESSPGMTVLDASSSLLTGVTFPAAGTLNVGLISGIGFDASANPVADWGDGNALLGYRGVGAGTVVGLNMQVITSDTAYQVINQPWASTLLNNAVNFRVAAAVPEPSTWAMMLLGFGAIGFAMRRRHGLSPSPSRTA
jgi:hypothetical protein